MEEVKQNTRREAVKGKAKLGKTEGEKEHEGEKK